MRHCLGTPVWLRAFLRSEGELLFLHCRAGKPLNKEARLTHRPPRDTKNSVARSSGAVARPDPSLDKSNCVSLRMTILVKGESRFVKGARPFQITGKWKKAPA